MNTQLLRSAINDYLDQADEKFLRLVYGMIESERNDAFFSRATNEDMRSRAEKSLQKIAEGNVRSILDFQKEVTSWKKTQSIL